MSVITEQLYQTKEAANYLRLSEKRVRELARGLVIKSLKPGKGYLFTKESLDEYLKGGEK